MPMAPLKGCNRHEILQLLKRLFMSNINRIQGSDPEALSRLLARMGKPFRAGDKVGIKIHWGERGNTGYLPPPYTREIVLWLKELGVKPFVFDTTVLYSGGRRTGTGCSPTPPRASPPRSRPSWTTRWKKPAGG